MEYAINIKRCFLATWNLSVPKDLSISDHPGLKYNYEGYMAQALAQYEDLFLLVSGYLYWHKNGLPNRV